MRKTMEQEDLPPVVLPSREVRKVLAGQKALVTGANSGMGKGVRPDGLGFHAGLMARDPDGHAMLLIEK